MKKRIYTSKSERSRKRRFFVAIVVLIMSFVLPWLFAKYGILGIGDESVVGVFSVCASVVGAVLVVFELNDNEQVTCCSMLSDMNMKFIENERLMLLYQELCACVQEPDRTLHVDNDDPKAIHSADLMAYMTFYEVINEYVKNGVLNIRQMDDLFGDRFFKLIHNSYVQEHELYAEPSSYTNIFQLYDMWRNYRAAMKQDDQNRFVVMNENSIPDMYMDRKLYLHETMQFFMNQEDIPFQKRNGQSVKLSLRRLLPRHFNQVWELQTQIVEDLADKAVFAISTRDEILESMLIDFCYGLFNEDQLVATCICVLNRKTLKTGDHERNLCVLTNDKKNYAGYVTFDSIQVHPDYRGYGIQRFFLQKAELAAQKVGASYLLATVSPDNRYSLDRFRDAGYEIFGQGAIPMYDAQRYLMIRQLQGGNQ